MNYIVSIVAKNDKHPIVLDSVSEKIAIKEAYLAIKKLSTDMIDWDCETDEVVLNKRTDNKFEAVMPIYGETVFSTNDIAKTAKYIESLLPSGFELSEEIMFNKMASAN